MLLLKSTRTVLTGLTIAGILAAGYLWAGPTIERLHAGMRQAAAELAR